MGVVTTPHLNHNNNGTVFLKRIATNHIQLKTTYRKCILDDYVLNHRMVTEWQGWNGVEDMMASEIVERVVELWAGQLADPNKARNNLVLRYHHKKKACTMKANESISSVNAKHFHDQNSDGVQLTPSDLCLCLCVPKGEVVQRDCSCDSTFMATAMREAGKAIRDKMTWVPPNEILYLIRDNAGGHGKKEVVQDYKDYLMDVFKIEIIHQVP